MVVMGHRLPSSPVDEPTARLAGVFGDAPLAEETVATLLREQWRLAAAHVEYARIGYGAYHWLATAGDGRWLVTADPVDGRLPVVHCYELARRLASGGLDLVRPPLVTRDGAVAVAAGEWWVSVWPWLAGRSATTGRHASAADVAAVAAAVRRLHDHPPGAIPAELLDDWAVDGWGRFVAAIGAPATVAGPYAAEVRDLVQRRREHIRDTASRYHERAAHRPPPAEWVVTHGEPHAANVVHTPGGPVLIDWDTARLAPRERDLWILAMYPGWQESYGDARVDPALLEAYRLRWDLTDIALFVPDLLAASAATPDLDVALEELHGYLAE